MQCIYTHLKLKVNRKFCGLTSTFIGWHETVLNQTMDNLLSFLFHIWKQLQFPLHHWYPVFYSDGPGALDLFPVCTYPHNQCTFSYQASNARASVVTAIIYTYTSVDGVSFFLSGTTWNSYSIFTSTVPILTNVLLYTQLYIVFYSCGVQNQICHEGFDALKNSCWEKTL